MEYIKSCTCLSFEPYKSHFTITVEEMISSFLLRSGGASCKPFFFFLFPLFVREGSGFGPGRDAGRLA